ncbi:MAG: hypothetical protein LBL59_09200 [Xanthomonadaceae bacterium]|nr:hypothetical protein [Xanthomonadaceae bacterium]
MTAFFWVCSIVGDAFLLLLVLIAWRSAFVPPVKLMFSALLLAVMVYQSWVYLPARMIWLGEGFIESFSLFRGRSRLPLYGFGVLEAKQVSLLFQARRVKIEVTTTGGKRYRWVFIAGRGVLRTHLRGAVIAETPEVLGHAVPG